MLFKMCSLTLQSFFIKNNAGICRGIKSHFFIVREFALILSQLNDCIHFCLPLFLTQHELTKLFKIKLISGNVSRIFFTISPFFKFLIKPKK
jgi:hypothetical protein